jgi:hypothetical protein
MPSRRDFLKVLGQGLIAIRGASLATAFASPGIAGGSGSLRCINVVNFIREIEPRFKMDMLLPVQRQMALILAHRLPATWLLQFDALVAGHFVEFLKAHMADNHEVGFWFEMNERLCKAADVPWRGRPGYEWDPDPTVAFTIGYTQAERIKLADAAMQRFKAVWGRYPRSVASWNLDAYVLQHLSAHYGIEAYATCRDQIATDGFTIWGAPIAGYYPSKINCWSPALERLNQISTPVFRMLGQDPVYYYTKEWTLPDGRHVHEPDTIEPVWTSGRSPLFVKTFLRMIAEAPALQFGYAQMGQENTFPWAEQEQAYGMQMAALANQRDQGEVHVETMGQSGARFRRAFDVTPAQAQVQLHDPFGNTDPAQRTLWYQSRFYRANLHMKGGLAFLRDIHVYSDRHPQPFLTEPTRSKNVEQKMLALMDGYHWSRQPGSLTDEGAGAYFSVAGERLELSDEPAISEQGSTLLADCPVGHGRVLHLRFDERRMAIRITPKPDKPLMLSFQWDPAKAALIGVTPRRATYRWQGFGYGVSVEDGSARTDAGGWTITGDGGSIVLLLAQPG